MENTKRFGSVPYPNQNRVQCGDKPLRLLYLVDKMVDGHRYITLMDYQAYQGELTRAYVSLLPGSLGQPKSPGAIINPSPQVFPNFTKPFSPFGSQKGKVARRRQAKGSEVAK